MYPFQKYRPNRTHQKAVTRKEDEAKRDLRKQSKKKPCGLIHKAFQGNNNLFRSEFSEKVNIFNFLKEN
jgi:hypothetical protein